MDSHNGIVEVCTMLFIILIPLWNPVVLFAFRYHINCQLDSFAHCIKVTSTLPCAGNMLELSVGKLFRMVTLVYDYTACNSAHVSDVQSLITKSTLQLFFGYTFLTNFCLLY